MLRSLKFKQKNPSEEDRTDSGSELGLEPETDRFGFFLTNGSTDGIQAGPSPASVRHREAKWIHIIDQWDHLFHKKASKIKMQCQKGIPASLRAKCWSLLSGATDRMKQQTDLYKFLDSQPASKHWEDMIKKDLDRQFPFHEMFVSKDGHGQRSLFQVLKAYAKFRPEDGYCQAQGPVAAVLLMIMPVEEAFWCLVQICEQYLPGYYSPLLEGVLFDADILTWVLKRSCPAAYKHLQHHDVEPLMFATDWLMCLFTRHLPFNTLLRVWDLFFCYGVRVLLQVTAVLVQRVLGHEDQRKQCCGQMETLQMLRSIKTEVKDEEDDFIVEVLSVPLTTRDLQRRTENELQRWQKERPSSTFDPRGRCLGYHMAWMRSQQSNEECARKEREKGNLSVPLSRSASTLSLSMSKWHKGVKTISGERKSNITIVRHRSMAAKMDCQSWANLTDKKNKGQEDYGFVSTEKKKQSNPRVKQETHQTELLKETELQQTEVQNVHEKNVHLQIEQMKEKHQSSADRNKQEENIDSTQLAPVEEDISAVQQRESHLSQTTTHTHMQSGVELMRVNNLYQVKSLKLLATQAARCSGYNSENTKTNLKNLGATHEQNINIDKDLRKLNLSGECHFSELLGEREMKVSHTQSELCELAEKDNVAVIQSQSHHERKSLTGYSNDIHTINQYITIEEKLITEGTVAGQTIAGSQNIIKTFEQTEDTTYSQEMQEPSILPSNLNIEADASIDYIMQDVPEREAQSNICEKTKNFVAFHQIESDFIDASEYSFRSFCDFRVRKSSYSCGSRFARRLSEDLFISPQLFNQRKTNYSCQEKNCKSSEILSSCETEEAATQHKEQQPRHFAIFHRVKEGKKNKKQSIPKIQVPKIMIQDFSDDREIGQGEVENKLTSKEKRRQKKEQKRKKREDERQRKKKKETEKAGKRDQTKGSSDHAQSKNINLQLGGATSLSTHYETSYAETYF